MIRKFYKKYEDKFNRSEDNFLHFLSWMCAGLAIGGVVGLVGVAFHLLLEWATEFRMETPWLIWLLPLGGLAIGISLGRDGKGQGNEFYSCSCPF